MNKNGWRPWPRRVTICIFYKCPYHGMGIWQSAVYCSVQTAVYLQYSSTAVCCKYCITAVYCSFAVFAAHCSAAVLQIYCSLQAQGLHGSAVPEQGWRIYFSSVLQPATRWACTRRSLCTRSCGWRRRAVYSLPLCVCKPTTRRVAAHAEGCAATRLWLAEEGYL